MAKPESGDRRKSVELLHRINRIRNGHRPALFAVAAAICVFTHAQVYALGPIRLPPTPYIPPPVQTPSFQNPLTPTLTAPDLRGTIPNIKTPDLKIDRSNWGTDSENLQRGYQFLQEQKYWEAITHLSRVSENADAIRGLAYAHRQLLAAAINESRYGDAVSQAANLSAYDKEAGTQALISLGYTLVDMERYEDARKAFDYLRDHPAAYEGIAQLYFKRGDIYSAFSVLSQLSSKDPKRAALLRGDLLMRLGAVPLAVAAYRPYAGDTNVDKVVADLAARGLDRFQPVETPPNSYWQGFAPVAPKGAERPILYMFRAGPSESPFGILYQRPAPRAQSAGNILSSVRHWTWPATQDASEYALTIQGVDAVYTAAIWDYRPSDKSLGSAFENAVSALDTLREAEKKLHSGDAAEAYRLFLGASDPEYFHLDMPHYAALSLALAAQVEGRLPGIEETRRKLERHYPFWGRLGWIQSLIDRDKLTEARQDLEALAKDWPLRIEPYKELLKLDGAQVEAAHGADRAAALGQLQVTVRKALARKPNDGEALLRKAEAHFLLRSYALASLALKAITPDEDLSGDAQVMRTVISAINQSSFQLVDRVDVGRSGFAFEVYRSLERPPADGTVDHHAAELALFDRDGRHIETFAVASQAFSRDLPRELFLERIGPDGIETIARYENGAPDPVVLARQLATLIQ